MPISATVLRRAHFPISANPNNRNQPQRPTLTLPFLTRYYISTVRLPNFPSEDLQLSTPELRHILSDRRRLSSGREVKTTMTNKPMAKFANYRRILEKKADEVRSSMSAQKAAQVVARLDVPSDEGDLSQQSHEEWIFLNRNTIDMKLLREISGALHRMDTGQYGTCMECEEAISVKRLDAVPWARYCVHCQDLVASRIASGESVEEFEDADR
jgi:DnaK suppressor protein